MAATAHLPSCGHGCGARPAILSFDVPARVEEIAPIVEQVIALASRQLGEDDDKHLQIGLALQEALANAVIHGAKKDESKNNTKDKTANSEIELRHEARPPFLT